MKTRWIYSSGRRLVLHDTKYKIYKKALGCENVNMQKSFLIHVSTRALLGSARRGGERARRGSRK